MARARFIRPEFFTDEKIGELPFAARLLFIGSWCHADINGVLEWKAKQLRALVFPHDEGVKSTEVDKWMGLIATSGLVEVYSVGAATYGIIKNFQKHQTFTKSEHDGGSRHPLPSGFVSTPRNMPGHTRSGSTGTDASATIVLPPVARSNDKPSPSPTPEPSPTPAPERTRDPVALESHDSATAEPADQDRWPYERREPWAQALVRAGAKIGANNWPVWKVLADAHGHDRVAEAVRSLPAGDRWPDRTEEALAPPVRKASDLARVIRDEYGDHLRWISVEKLTKVLDAYGEQSVRNVCEIARKHGIVFDADDWREAFLGRRSEYGNGWDFWRPQPRLPKTQNSDECAARAAEVAP